MRQMISFYAFKKSEKLVASKNALDDAHYFVIDIIDAFSTTGTILRNIKNYWFSLRRKQCKRHTQGLDWSA